MTELQGVIHYWEYIIQQHGYLLEPGTSATISMTISYLKMLQTIKEGE